MSMNSIVPLYPPLADAMTSSRVVVIRDLVVAARIGVHAHEQDAPQPVRINLEVHVAVAAGEADRIDQVLCYQTLIDDIGAVLSAGHINLVETLAEQILDLTLAHPLARAARISVEKLAAVDEAAAVGVRITRGAFPPGA